MSIRNNDARTLSGIDNSNIRGIDIPSTRDAIRIGGNIGTVRQVVGKSADSDVVSWVDITDTQIEDGAIVTRMLNGANNYLTTGTMECSTFSTTGNATIGGNLQVDGDINLDDIVADDITFNDLFGRATLPAGTLNFTVAGASGNITTNGTFTGTSIAGTSITNSGLTTTAGLTFTSGNLTGKSDVDKTQCFNLDLSDNSNTIPEPLDVKHQDIIFYRDLFGTDGDGGTQKFSVSGATGNLVSSGTISTSGNITSQANMSCVNLSNSGTITSTGNISSSANLTCVDITNSGKIASTGNIISSGNLGGVNIANSGTTTTNGNIVSSTGDIVSSTGAITGVTVGASTTIGATGNITTDAKFITEDGIQINGGLLKGKSQADPTHCENLDLSHSSNVFPADPTDIDHEVITFTESLRGTNGAVGAIKFLVDATNGNTTTSGTLGITGLTTANGGVSTTTLSTSGAITSTGIINSNGGISNTGTITSTGNLSCAGLTASGVSSLVGLITSQGGIVFTGGEITGTATPKTKCKNLDLTDASNIIPNDPAVEDIKHRDITFYRDLFGTDGDGGTVKFTVDGATGNLTTLGNVGAVNLTNSGTHTSTGLLTSNGGITNTGDIVMLGTPYSQGGTDILNLGAIPFIATSNDDPCVLRRLKIDGSLGKLEFGNASTQVIGFSNANRTPFTNCDFSATSNTFPSFAQVDANTYMKGVDPPATATANHAGQMTAFQNLLGYTNQNQRIPNGDLSFTATGSGTGSQVRMYFEIDVFAEFRDGAWYLGLMEIDSTNPQTELGMLDDSARVIFQASSDVHTGQHHFYTYAQLTRDQDYVVAPYIFGGTSSSGTQAQVKVGGNSGITDPTDNRTIQYPSYRIKAQPTTFFNFTFSNSQFTPV